MKKTLKRGEWAGRTRPASAINITIPAVSEDERLYIGEKVRQMAQALAAKITARTEAQNAYFQALIRSARTKSTTMFAVQSGNSLFVNASGAPLKKLQNLTIESAARCMSSNVFYYAVRSAKTPTKIGKALEGVLKDYADKGIKIDRIFVVCDKPEKVQWLGVNGCEVYHL
jgi:hypothetical protein